MSKGREGGTDFEDDVQDGLVSGRRELPDSEERRDADVVLRARPQLQALLNATPQPNIKNQFLPFPHNEERSKARRKETDLQVCADSLAAAHDIRHDLRALGQRELDGLGLGELVEEVDDVVEVRQEQLLERFLFGGLGGWFAVDRKLISGL